jgi:Cu/Ag efflux protein CusF
MKNATRSFSKSLTALLAAVLLAPASVVFASEPGHELQARTARFPMLPMTRGFISDIDRYTGRIKITHEKNPDVDLTATTTIFRILPTDIPWDIENGTSVIFVAAQVGDMPMVTRIEPRKN